MAGCRPVCGVVARALAGNGASLVGVLEILRNGGASGHTAAVARVDEQGKRPKGPALGGKGVPLCLGRSDGARAVEVRNFEGAQRVLRGAAENEALRSPENQRRGRCARGDAQHSHLEQRAAEGHRGKRRRVPPCAGVANEPRRLAAAIGCVQVFNNVLAVVQRAAGVGVNEKGKHGFAAELEDLAPESRVLDHSVRPERFPGRGEHFYVQGKGRYRLPNLAAKGAALVLVQLQRQEVRGWVCTVNGEGARADPKALGQGARRRVRHPAQPGR
mmetsp:Transcript_19279/g.73856  ORF Transcript_19279/g.73856 Transcript_19279/m.73856 type:complete len:273 (-) Transcript_19279:101-919(-)